MGERLSIKIAEKDLYPPEHRDFIIFIKFFIKFVADFDCNKLLIPELRLVLFKKKL